MLKKIVHIVVIILAAFGLMSFLPTISEVDMHTQDNHEEIHGESHMDHMHDQVDVSDVENIPAVSLNVSEDSKSGWNLNIQTENFEFDPKNANAEHVNGFGHAHLYINGEKITRLYGEWYYIDQALLKDGENEIMVTLNTNDHKDLIANDESVADVVVVAK